MKILTIIGARPQFIKAALLSRKFINNPEIEEVIVHTGQHFDDNMSEVFFQEMEIPHPHYNLNINNVSHGAMTGRMLESIEKVLVKEKPALVLVYGDTNSTLAGALAAKKLHVKIAHVEAGLRSFNMQMPEEINRILTDRISNLLFCPTDAAVKNLNQEGFCNFDCRIVKSGDIMKDAALYYSGQSQKKSTVLEKYDLNKFILCTLHRQENTDNISRLSDIIDALNELSNENQIILPLHPRTKEILRKNKLKLYVKIIEPLGYFDMLQLLKHCQLVMTDSGGLQKEAFFFRKNCVTMRDQTEWRELVENNLNIIAGADKQRIIDGVDKMLHQKSDFDIDLFGNGKAAEVIFEHIVNV